MYLMYVHNIHVLVYSRTTLITYHWLKSSLDRYQLGNFSTQSANTWRSQAVADDRAAFCWICKFYKNNKNENIYISVIFNDKT